MRPRRLVGLQQWRYASGSSDQDEYSDRMRGQAEGKILDRRRRRIRQTAGRLRAARHPRAAGRESAGHDEPGRGGTGARPRRRAYPRGAARGRDRRRARDRGRDVDERAARRALGQASRLRRRGRVLRHRRIARPVADGLGPRR